MISFDEARAIIAAGTLPLPAHGVPLGHALGTVSAAPVVSAIPVPGFANAAMDGFAVPSAATAGASPEHPLSFAVLGSIPAGSPVTKVPAGAGVTGAFEIMTGAPVPAGCDAVVPVERVTTQGQPPRTVTLTLPAEPGQNVRHAGEDFRPGSPIVAAGTWLGPQHLMALAACGVTGLAVRRAPRVAILTTGNELGTPGRALDPGQIHDANGPYLAALLRLLGVELVTAATSPDEPDALRHRLLELRERADLILTTGGVSAGRLDLLPDAVRSLGGSIGFHKVGIRPGKPLLYGRLSPETALFGLPGNPLAVVVGMRFFVIPALRALLGLPPEQEEPARLLAPLRGRGKLLFFAKARVTVATDGQRCVEILPGQESFRIAPLMAANAWALVPGDTALFQPGTLLMTLPLYPADPPAAFGATPASAG